MSKLGSFKDIASLSVRDLIERFGSVILDHAGQTWDDVENPDALMKKAFLNMFTGGECGSPVPITPTHAASAYDQRHTDASSARSPVPESLSPTSDIKAPLPATAERCKTLAENAVKALSSSTAASSSSVSNGTKKRAKVKGSASVESGKASTTGCCTYTFTRNSKHRSKGETCGEPTYGSSGYCKKHPNGATPPKKKRTAAASSHVSDNDDEPSGLPNDEAVQLESAAAIEQQQYEDAAPSGAPAPVEHSAATSSADELLKTLDRYVYETSVEYIHIATDKHGSSYVAFGNATIDEWVVVLFRTTEQGDVIEDKSYICGVISVTDARRRNLDIPTLIDCLVFPDDVDRYDQDIVDFLATNVGDSVLNTQTLTPPLDPIDPTD